MKFKVSANPKGGSVFQFVEADSEEEAVEKAKDNPDGWKIPTLNRGHDDWSFRAYPMGNDRPQRVRK